MTPLRARLIAAIAAALLCGCVTPGPTPRMYVLTPVGEPGASAPMAVAAKPVTVVIQDIRLPLYLDRPQIVTRDRGNRLEISENEQWGGHLREDMARVLAMNLGRLLDGERVVAAPCPAPAAPHYRVEVDILGFERQPGGRVVLTAQWSITPGADAAQRVGSGGTFSGEPLAQAVSYDKLVQSMSAVYGELAQAIARSIRFRIGDGT
ncbi:MAG: membrane integrity-associated transporter subunit PqiC [Rhodocyclales bacterium]|nr:membrane integrity-associated transporter subunit PqiC [Rhodocyclales bacterium]